VINENSTLVTHMNLEMVSLIKHHALNKTHVYLLYTLIAIITLCNGTTNITSHLRNQTELDSNQIQRIQCPVEANILSKGLVYSNITRGTSSNTVFWPGWNISIPSKDFYTHVIHERDPIKLNVTSSKGYPFSVIVYTIGGKTLKYAGTNIVHTGSVSYFEIYNLVEAKNKIIVSLSELSHEISYFDLVMSILSLTAITLVIYETKSNVLKGVLLILSLGEIYNAWQTGSLNGLTTRMRVNLLKIK